MTPFDELKQQLDSWWMAGDQDAREKYFVDYASATQVKPDIDLNVLMDYLGDSMAMLAWVNAQMPEARAFATQAKGLASEELRPKYDGQLLRDMVKAKCVYFDKLVDALDRLSATLLHRMDALRTLVSAERSRLEQLTEPRQGARLRI